MRERRASRSLALGASLSSRGTVGACGGASARRDLRRVVRPDFRSAECSGAAWDDEQLGLCAEGLSPAPPAGAVTTTIRLGCHSKSAVSRALESSALGMKPAAPERAIRPPYSAALRLEVRTTVGPW